MGLHLQVKMRASYSPAQLLRDRGEGIDERMKSSEQKVVCDLGVWKNESETLSQISCKTGSTMLDLLCPLNRILGPCISGHCYALYVTHKDTEAHRQDTVSLSHPAGSVGDLGCFSQEWDKEGTQTISRKTHAKGK